MNQALLQLPPLAALMPEPSGWLAGSAMDGLAGVTGVTGMTGFAGLTGSDALGFWGMGLSLDQGLAAVGLVGGLVLLAMGARVLSASVIVLGLSVGAFLGLSLGRAAGVGAVGEVPGSMLTCGVGAVAGGLIGMAMIRLAIGAASTATFGALGLLGSATVLVIGGTIASPRVPTTSALATGISESASVEAGTRVRAATRTNGTRAGAVEHASDGASGSASSSASSSAGSSAGSSATDHAIRVAGEQAGAYATDYWSTLPASSRATIVWSTLGGAVLGLALGTLMPRRAAALVTALAGAGGAIIGARVLAMDDASVWLDPGSMGVVGWLAIWIALAAAGMWVQARFARGGGERSAA